MSDAALSTIAQLLYASPHGFNFARVVGEVETQLSRLRSTTLRTHWDCEDIVLFDVNDIRIGLAWSDAPCAGMAGCILISVGPCPGTIHPHTDPAHEALCSRLVERIQLRYPPDAMLWHQTAEPMQPDLVDSLADVLPTFAHLLTPDAPSEPTAPPVAAPLGLARPVRRVATPNPSAVVNDRPDLPRPSEPDLSTLRAALYPKVEVAPPTVQMRLAAHSMNATLIMVWMPLGAAVMTYSLLKGEDIRLSARLMAVTGTLFALSQTPLAQSVAAMAGV